MTVSCSSALNLLQDARLHGSTLLLKQLNINCGQFSDACPLQDAAEFSLSISESHKAGWAQPGEA